MVRDLAAGEALRRLVIIAAITKRAQIPFSAWLPAAIAAPTPVRALVHSSTLVTAGVYLLIRFFPRIYIRRRLSFLLWVRLLTTFIAGINALFEIDLKKVIALSTLSQLGIIITTLRIGFPLLSYFHLLTHALFKALLFICGGKIIHISQRSQDLRFIGGLIFSNPVTRVVLNLSNYALCGFPFLAGYYSKDLIMEVLLGEDLFMSIYFMVYIAVGLSVVYSLRFSFFSLRDFSHQNLINYGDEKDWRIIFGKLILVRLSLFGGACLY
jgi:NADH-ubiquinone oxidoreductase chain 5